jgi:hypothetical protein
VLDRIATSGVVPDLDAGAARSLVRIGNALAVAGSRRCLDAWQLVADHAPDPADRAFARFRAIVALVKRLDGTGDEIDAAFEATEAAAADVPAGLDARALAAVLGNLRALTCLRTRAFGAAREHVEGAWAAVAEDAAAGEDGDEVRFEHVRAQVLANVAFVAGAGGDWTGAAAMLADGVRIADRTGSVAKQLEARCLLGYARWQAGDGPGARETLLEADALGHRLGASTQHLQAWKLLAVIADDEGDEAAREAWLARLAQHEHGTEDPAT